MRDAVVVVRLEMCFLMLLRQRADKARDSPMFNVLACDLNCCGISAVCDSNPKMQGYETIPSRLSR